MRRSIVTLITRRELRDLMRDRRTLFIVLILPALLYPVFGLVGVVFAMTTLEQKIVVGVSGVESLPPLKEHAAALLGGGLVQAECDRRLDDPALIADNRFLPYYVYSDAALSTVVVKPLDSDDPSVLEQRQVDVLLCIPDDFLQKIHRDERPAVHFSGAKAMKPQSWPCVELEASSADGSSD